MIYAHCAISIEPKLFRFILLVFIHLGLTLALASVCFLLMPINGDYFGVLLAQLWLVAVLLFGDRFLLSTLKAKRLSSASPLCLRLANLRVLRRHRQTFEVFESRDAPDNILVISSPLRAPAILVGQNILTKMREKDLDQVLNFALLRLESGHWTYACLSAQLLALLAVPAIFLRVVGLGSLLHLALVPSEVLTKFFWKLGGVKEINQDLMDYALAAYPRLWGRVWPQTRPGLKVFLVHVLDYMLLIPAPLNAEGKIARTKPHSLSELS